MCPVRAASVSPPSPPCWPWLWPGRASGSAFWMRISPDLPHPLPLALPSARVQRKTDCILREMGEELGITEADVKDLRMRYITYRLKDGEIRQNYYFFGELKDNRELKSSEGNLEWIPYEGFDSLNMPVSAKHMILHYLKVGRFDDRLYAGITQRDGTCFVPMEEFEG